MRAAFPKDLVTPSVAVDYNSVKYAIRLDNKLVVNQACFPRFTCRVVDLGRFPYKQQVEAAITEDHATVKQDGKKSATSFTAPLRFGRVAQTS